MDPLPVSERAFVLRYARLNSDLSRYQSNQVVFQTVLQLIDHFFTYQFCAQVQDQSFQLIQMDASETIFTHYWDWLSQSH